MVSSDKPVIVVSNAAGGGGAGGKGKDDKEGIFKLPKTNVNTFITIGGLIALAGIGYYAFTQLPNLADSITSAINPQGNSTSGTSATTTSSPSIVTQTPVLGGYPGTGAGTFPPPSVTQPAVPGIYPYTTQGFPLPVAGALGGTPYATTTTAPLSAGIPNVVRSYHAHISDECYLDHRGRKRRYHGDKHVEELIGSEQEDPFKVIR
jgi:predicted RecA/RadA family phage recombinase